MKIVHTLVNDTIAERTNTRNFAPMAQPNRKQDRSGVHPLRDSEADPEGQQGAKAAERAAEYLTGSDQ